ncbi:proteobacterial dedicated sortase system histidine kinase [Solemya velesiana gill symbiont]|uniref:histidine kinase n=1 Tax=Solemya velesiana gill symbiont TaxID=1918948 RepID=A0A1T2KVP5_9GAMM|nr:proteobacterial dedicated sortase system histidine kinase [Solemya velesiana gill symbiont]OOZ36894.1 proteobacterial dedicated sortase system histidine kinase [Solemya velesiana gill symbiont]
MSQPFRHSIRFKLLLVSLILLVIPWAGYRYVQETESFLRNAQETMLLGTAQTVGALLHNHEEMFVSGPTQPGQSESFLYVHPLTSPIQLDGYTEDWEPHLRNLWRYKGDGDLAFEALLGERQGYLYLLVQVKDDRIVYQAPGERALEKSDFISLRLTESSGEIIDYGLSTIAPGWIVAERVITRAGRRILTESEPRIQGEWTETANGYAVELRIPHYLIGDRLDLSVWDVDATDSRQLVNTVRTRQGNPERLPGRLVTPNPDMARIIGGLEHENARIWVLNRNRQVLAKRGVLRTAEATAQQDQLFPRVLNALLRLIVDQPSEQFLDEFSGKSQLSGPELDAALTGTPETRRRITPDGEATILSAAWPIRSADGIVGVVLVEQSTNQILALQNEALKRLFGTTALLFVITILLLLGFATLLTRRISRLRNRVESAVTPDGRIKGELTADRTKDEIGDLNRSFASVLNRLSEYNRYLEAMASRLAHELRTPLTVVKSSLENLESEHSAEQRDRCIMRAKEGSERLGLILHRMREATRLEQLLQQTEFETFDLKALVSASAEGYSTAFPGCRFEITVPQEPVKVHGAPDLVGQALDKLVANAVDFHEPGSAILLQLENKETDAMVSVVNQGPLLPGDMSQEIFGSMISVRNEKGDEPHLGLGLYLVRLIAEFHGGKVWAGNLSEGEGVKFTIQIPMEQ